MDIKNALTVFDNWLKGLGDGEATFYGILLTGAVGFLGWLIKQYRQKNAQPESAEKNHTTNGSIVAKEINDSHVQIINHNIHVKKVKATKGGTATGVIIGDNESKRDKQDEQDRN